MVSAIQSQGLQTAAQPGQNRPVPEQAQQAQTREETPASGLNQGAGEDTVELSAQAQGNSLELNQTAERGQAAPPQQAALEAEEETARVEETEATEESENTSTSSSGRETNSPLEETGAILNLIA